LTLPIWVTKTVIVGLRGIYHFLPLRLRISAVQ